MQSSDIDWFNKVFEEHVDKGFGKDLRISKPFLTLSSMFMPRWEERRQIEYFYNDGELDYDIVHHYLETSYDPHTRITLLKKQAQEATPYLYSLWNQAIGQKRQKEKEVLVEKHGIKKVLVDRLQEPAGWQIPKRFAGYHFLSKVELEYDKHINLNAYWK